MAKVHLALGLLLLIAMSEVCEVQGTFLLMHFLRKIPRRRRIVRLFAFYGMMRFVNLLQLRSPSTPQYKTFFGSLRSYMNFINSAAGSTNFNSELKGQAQGLHSAISGISGNSGTSGESNKVMSTLLSMGKTLGQQPDSSSTVMTVEQRKEMIINIVTWARTIVQFVSSCAAQSGSKIDISSFGLDTDVKPIVPQDSTPNPIAPQDSTPNPIVPQDSTTTTGETSTVGTQTSSCMTHKCSNGGGDSNSVQSSMNVQQGGQVSSQSQQSVSSQS